MITSRGGLLVLTVAAAGIRRRGRPLARLAVVAALGVAGLASQALATAPAAHAQATAPAGPPTTTFTYTGTEQAYTVPAGVTALAITAIGAPGAAGIDGGSPGGFGASVTATVPLPGGTTTVYVEVGGPGGTWPNVAGGFNGGGSSAGNGNGDGSGAGAGASDVRTVSCGSPCNTAGPASLASRLVVAGGGGGGSWLTSCAPEGDGGTAGDTSVTGPGNGGGGDDWGCGGPGGNGGLGGTAGGAGGSGSPDACPGDPGSLGQGGSSPNCAFSGSGGGGGGYYGGGGGGAGAAGGGGGGAGSSFWATGATATSMSEDTTGTPEVQITPATSPAQPPGRGWPSFAYDPAHRDLVLFGGDNGSTVFGDTWTRKPLKGAGWVRRHPARSPSPRTGAAMVYDAATSQLLLFGGSTRIGTGGGFLGDTWTWNGTTWRQLHPAASPPARHNADMIYDAATGDVVLFGGYDGSYLGDTWTWNGTTWTQQTTRTAPAPRDTGSFAYDAAAGTGILYGGFNGTTAFTDTWSWNGTTWTQLSPATSPGPVTAAWQMAYDPATQQILLFGGGKANHTNSDATWDFNGTTWTRLNPATTPGGRGAGSMTYNNATGRPVLFGGQGPGQNTYPTVTWNWTGTTWHLVG